MAKTAASQHETGVFVCVFWDKGDYRSFSGCERQSLRGMGGNMAREHDQVDNRVID